MEAQINFDSLKLSSIERYKSNYYEEDEIRKVILLSLKDKVS